ncbi:elongation factor P maturation arginine rhamnosyltransferase EarP [Variovorax sp. ZT4R33]|uniref:elongation factor P maturation arginine rhamnosyltransferase EarP n=1 Tax=Variovorax sp. ZT4R33 TaxID=3443743 RepID=UPI003F481534
MRWDIFCKVIDNFGDIAVCWRLARELGRRGMPVRLWVDDPSALAWLAPGGADNVSVVPWSDPTIVAEAATRDPLPDVLIEAFGCDPAAALLARFAEVARHARRPWINLEYLSAEPYVARLHGLPSPVFQGPGEGLTKHFFYPGFSPATGGLLREPNLSVHQAAFDRKAWLARHGIDFQGERLVSLFCYEPRALPRLLQQLGASPTPVRLLVTAGRATSAVQAALASLPGTAPLPALDFLPLLPQQQYDELLWSCDFNFVRGEDSIVRALWAGRPFAWQIYPQDDDAHHVKLHAFLDVIEAPTSWRAFHLAWNDASDGPLAWPDDGTRAAWQEAATQARARLQAQDDLASQLVRFAVRHGPREARP